MGKALALKRWKSGQFSGGEPAMILEFFEGEELTVFMPIAAARELGVALIGEADKSEALAARPQ